MTEKLIFGIAFCLLAGISMAVLRRFRVASPVFWHIPALTLMALGSLPFLRFDEPIGAVYMFLHALALIVFVTTAAVTLSRCRAGTLLQSFERSPTNTEDTAVRPVVFAFLLLSMAITVVYYVMVGYNVLWVLLTSGSVEGYSAMRLDSYSGDRYFAPGYVNQFKNVLLPITASVVGYWLIRSRNIIVTASYLAVMVPFVIIAIAGTGQRGYLFFSGGAFLMAFLLYRLGRPIRINPLLAAVATAPVVWLFGLMTASYYEAGDSNFVDIAVDIISRFTSIQQEGGFIAFRYIYDKDIVWFAEWLQGFVGILPGVEGSRIAHEVHALMYGSDRGTVPLTTVGSGYHNGGVLGVAVMFGVMGWLYAWTYVQFLRGPRTIVRCLVYGFLFFYVTVWIAEGPVTLVENGVVACIALLYATRRASSKLVAKVTISAGGNRIRRDVASDRLQ